MKTGVLKSENCKTILLRLAFLMKTSISLHLMILRRDEYIFLRNDNLFFRKLRDVSSCESGLWKLMIKFGKGPNMRDLANRDPGRHLMG